MKRFLALLLLCLFFLHSCKKDMVDASTTKTFQASINDMTSSLNTLQQIKFNEALYILKKFAVTGEDDVTELKELGKLINGKKVPEILALADQAAQKNGVAWSSTGPPSLGEMNIFGNENAKESDPNDIDAKSVAIVTRPISVDSILGPKAMQVVPRLVDGSGNPVKFEGAALETVMQVSSNGTNILTSKNLMLDNKFPGFTLRYAALPREKLTDNKVDITVSIKTTKKTYKMSKIGVEINPKALLMPQVKKPDENTGTDGQVLIPNPPVDDNNPTNATSTPTTGDPKTTVSKFLNNLSAQNLRGAYDTSDNPSWGSYETFSNPTSGFGGVKNISVKNISTNSASSSSASVNATYDVTDANGKTSALKVTFGLKNVDGEWKISSYRIN